MQVAQRIHHVRVVPLACPSTDVFHPFDRRHQRPSIETGPRDGVKGIGDREDACSERNDIALQTGRITRPIPTLMVVPHERRNLSQGGMLRDHVCPDIGVSSHDLPLLLSQWPWLVEDVVTNTNLAKVVEGPRRSYQLNLAIAELEPFAQMAGELSDSDGVRLRVTIPRVKGLRCQL